MLTHKMSINSNNVVQNLRVNATKWIKYGSTKRYYYLNFHMLPIFIEMSSINSIKVDLDLDLEDRDLTCRKIKKK